MNDDKSDNINTFLAYYASLVKKSILILFEI